MEIINFEKDINAETVFFFGVSNIRKENRLFRKVGNPYTVRLRGKHIIIDRKIRKKFPNYCYLKVNTAIEKENCYIITNADLMLSQKTTKEELKNIKSKIITRPNSAIKNTIKYYNVKSKLGNIDCLIATYKMNGYNNTYFDCYLNCNKYIFTVDSPINFYNNGKNPPNNNYSEIYFKDFEEII